MTEEIKAVSYCVGMSIADSLLQQELNGISPEIVADAIKDIFGGVQAQYTPTEANEIIQSYLNKWVKLNLLKSKKREKRF